MAGRGLSSFSGSLKSALVQFALDRTSWDHRTRLAQVSNEWPSDTGGPKTPPSQRNATISEHASQETACVSDTPAQNRVPHFFLPPVFCLLTYDHLILFTHKNPKLPTFAGWNQRLDPPSSPHLAAFVNKLFAATLRVPAIGFTACLTNELGLVTLWPLPQRRFSDMMCSVTSAMSNSSQPREL